jgi:hypothetical protein
MLVLSAQDFAKSCVEHGIKQAEENPAAPSCGAEAVAVIMPSVAAKTGIDGSILI